MLQISDQSRRKAAGDYSWLKKYSKKTDLSMENQGVVMDARVRNFDLKKYLFVTIL